jgi:hypothetical protein
VGLWRAILVGYISRLAGIFLWVLGLVITSSVVYMIYIAAVPYLPSFISDELLAALLILAWIAILAYWASALSHGVSGR